MEKLKERIRALLEPYAKNDKYNTQDMVQIGSYLLKNEGIEHQTYINEGVPYYWIMIEEVGLHVSFKPGLLILENDRDTSLNGKPIKMLANSITFEAITGEQP